ncbi:DUF6880 family protein [Brevundimonas sp.]
MAKAAPKLRKTLSQANLVHLGGERLAALLFEAAAADPALKRSLRLEIAAELGSDELAEALAKRMGELGSSKGRISWRKRPELLRELGKLRMLIVERLAAADAVTAFASLVSWVDLLEPLQARTKDPRGELPALFEQGSGDVATLALAVGPTVAVPLLTEAVTTRSSVWAGVIGAGAVNLDASIARRLLQSLVRDGIPNSGRLAPVVRRLADRVGAVDEWLATHEERQRRDPSVQKAAALRLAHAGRAQEAREALDAALVQPQKRGVGWRAPEPAPVRDEPWYQAEIAVLEAEGQGDAATQARWARFERLLSVEALREILVGLEDFEDVEATDRAIAFAAQAFDLNRALDFLMGWGALREAAQTIERRWSELNGRAEAIPPWASRLSSRYPLAAVHLLRARARALSVLGGSLNAEGVPEALDEAAALAEPLGGDVVPHATFVRDLLAERASGRSLRGR